MNNNDDWFLKFIICMTIFIFLFGIFIAHSIGAESCEYDNQTTSTMQGTVDSVIVKDKTVTEYFRETKKCKVIIKAKVQGKWYITSEDYIFTPDMSENEACQNAVNRAKERLLQEFVPETLESTKNLNCQVRDLTKQRIECRIETLNVVMPGLGLQEVKLKQCNR